MPGRSGYWLMAVSVTSPHSRLLSNFNDFFKDFPVKMLWPDQFTGADRPGAGRVLYWKIYRLASHKKDLAQILCEAGSGPGKYETIINTGQEWFYSHRHHTRGGREETVCPGLITFVFAKLPEYSRGPPGPCLSRIVSWRRKERVDTPLIIKVSNFFFLCSSTHCLLPF